MLLLMCAIGTARRPVVDAIVVVVVVVVCVSCCPSSSSSCFCLLVIPATWPRVFDEPRRPLPEARLRVMGDDAAAWLRVMGDNAAAWLRVMGDNAAAWVRPVVCNNRSDGDDLCTCCRLFGEPLGALFGGPLSLPRPRPPWLVNLRPALDDIFVNCDCKRASYMAGSGGTAVDSELLSKMITVEAAVLCELNPAVSFILLLWSCKAWTPSKSMLCRCISL